MAPEVTGRPEAGAVQGPDAERPVVADYTSDWPARAASLIATLRDQLGARAARIEHIGSTAIPGMAAKDVLDLQISVTSLEDATREYQQLVSTRTRQLDRQLDKIDELRAAREDLAAPEITAAPQRSLPEVESV